LGKRRVMALFLWTWIVLIFFMPAYWNTFGMPLEPVMATLYSSLHRFMFSIGLLASILIAREVKLFFLPSSSPDKEISVKQDTEEENERETADLNRNIIENNKTVQHVTLVDAEQVQRDAPMRQALQMAMAAFKCAARLCFSLYLTHSIFIRYNWFTSRSLFTFSEQARVS
jgi:hypothetical protein